MARSVPGCKPLLRADESNVATRVSEGRKAAVAAEMAVVEVDGLVARLTDRVFDNPAMSGGLFVMALTAAAIVSNAMFLQSGHHPEPLFMTRPAADLLDGDSVPLPRSRADRTGSIAPAVVDEPPLPRLQPAQKVATAPAVPAADRTVITDIQRALAERGLYKGAVDGISGSRTRAAITAFQKSQKLPVTGQPSAAVLDTLRAASVAVAAKPAPKAPAVAAAPPPAKPATRVAAAPVPPADIPAPPPAVPVAAAPAPKPVAVAAAPAADPDDAIASMVEPPAAPPPPARVVAAPAPAPVAEAPGSGIDEAAAVMTTAPAIETPPPVRKVSATPDGGIEPAPVRPAVAAAPAPAPAVASAGRMTAIQRALNDIGYGPVAETGVADDATSDAIRRFELDNGLPLTGRPEDRVVNRLVSIGAMEAI